MVDGATLDGPAVGWARVYPTLKPAFSKNLRQGAWYPVIDDADAERVEILLAERRIAIPRRFVEVRQDRPAHFSVVHRAEATDVKGPAANFDPNRRYAACPVCAHRQPFIGRPSHQVCVECGHRGEVGWWEA